MRFAFADPPYLGCCRLYDHFHPDGLCWDDPATHRELIGRLTAEYPDGWALSCTSVSLRTLLPMCPEDVRVGAWVKPFHVYKKGVRPAYAWEPLIYRAGRNPSAGHKHAPPVKGGEANTPKDFLSCNITLKKGLTGAKPPKFNRWVLDLLAFDPDQDTIDDLFPGSGSMALTLTEPTLNFGTAS